MPDFKQIENKLLDSLLDYVKEIVAEAIKSIEKAIKPIEERLDKLEEAIETLKKP